MTITDPDPKPPTSAPVDEVTLPDFWSDEGEMHFRLSDSALGDLDLICSKGYVVQSYDLGTPAVREVVYPNAIDNGTQDLTQFFGNRAITMDIMLKTHQGTGPTSAWVGSESFLRDKLLAFTGPAVRPQLIFTEHKDLRVKAATMRGASTSVVVERGDYNKITASWVIPSGVFLSWMEKCYSFVFSTQSSDSQTAVVLNSGSAPAHWHATLSGESVHPRFILDGNPNHVLQLQYDALPGDTIEINSYDRTVVINGRSTGYRYIPEASEWWVIPPGYHHVTIEHDTYTKGGFPPALWQPHTATSEWDTPPWPSDTTTAPPPWAWTTRRDPNTGGPGAFELLFCFYDTYL